MVEQVNGETYTQRRQREHKERLERIRNSPFMTIKLQTPEQHQILVTACKFIAEFLEFHSILSFARINKAVFESLAQHISTRFWLIYDGDAYPTLWPFKKYTPTKVKLKMTVDMKLPEYITHVVCDHSINAVPPFLPPRLTHLTFGRAFNKPLTSLPSTLTHLTLGGYFNQPLDELPPCLTHLTIGVSFDQPLDKLPSSLTYLCIGRTYTDQQVVTASVLTSPLTSLPASLTELYLDTMLSQSVNSFPPNLTHLSIQNIDKSAFVTCPFPASLTHLYITRQAIAQLQHPIPESVKIQRYF